MVEQGGFTTFIPREIFMAINGSPQTDQKIDQKTDQKAQILKLLKGNPKISRSQLAESIGIHPSSVKRRLEELINEGNVKRVGADKGGYWEIIE